MFKVIRFKFVKFENDSIIFLEKKMHSLVCNIMTKPQVLYHVKWGFPVKLHIAIVNLADWI